jgi:hypothetical protein
LIFVLFLIVFAAGISSTLLILAFRPVPTNASAAAVLDASGQSADACL